MISIGMDRQLVLPILFGELPALFNKKVRYQAILVDTHELIID